jgi:hypothetical protein
MTTTITNARVAQVLRLAAQHFDAFVTEAVVLLGGDADSQMPSETTLSESSPQTRWVEVSNSLTESFRWPDGNEDDYADFISYVGEGGQFDGMRLALGFKDDGDNSVVGFLLGKGGGSKRPVVVFYPAPDESGELLAMIRGRNGGRSGFAPGELLPDEYRPMQTAVLGERIPGKWKVQAVIASSRIDTDTMLRHTALQVHRRSLTTSA